MDTISREEVAKVMITIGNCRKILGAMQHAVGFLDKKIAEIELQVGLWEARLDAHYYAYEEEENEN